MARCLKLLNALSLPASTPSNARNRSDRNLLAGLEFQVAALLHHLVKRERIFAAEGEHHLLLQAGILRAFPMMPRTAAGKL